MLAFYAGFTLLIGFVEEVYFRGLMLQALKPRGMWQATVFISLLFGMSHALNLFAGAAPLYTLLQLGYATAFGLAFAALVWVTGLIWPVIVAHALTDFAAALNSAGGLISTTVTPTDYAITAFSVLLFSSYAVILLATARRAETSSVLEAMGVSRHEDVRGR
jgi:membrane protease YdiL (CAAX protease family)